MQKNKTILVVGGGSAGWMSAGYYATKGYDVTLVESPHVGVVGVGESTLPAMNWFAHELGMVEEEWMPMCDATYKMAIKHEGWTSPDSNWWHWFIYDRNQSTDQLKYIETNTRPSYDKFEYGYHVDAFKFGNTIGKSAAFTNGCKHIIAHITEVIGNAETGISAIVTEDGKHLTADFYIDCTGFRKLLASKVGIEYKPYKHLINDRAIASPQPSLPVINQYTTTIKKSAGWIWEIPLSTRRGTGYVYSSKYITDEQATEEYCTHYPGTDRSQLNYIKFTPEVALNPIHLNVVAVGLSSGFIEPLEATSLFLTQFMIRQAHLVLSGERSPRVINRNQQKVFDHVAYYVLCHYTLSGNIDNDYWRYYNELEKELNTLQKVKEQAAEDDVQHWKETKLFFSYSQWALLNGYNIQ